MAPTRSSAGRAAASSTSSPSPGTNEFHGSAHYFGKYDALSADFSHTFPGGATTGFAPDFSQHQFGATLGGPLVRDKAFFFLAYDQQEYNETKQTDRLGAIDPALLAFVDTAFGGALAGDFGPISRTNDANAFLAKLDFRLGQKHNATLKYNYTNSQQQNGTFDVDFWGRSANALERDFSHAVNGSLTSLFSSSLSNEFRFQWAREDRPRPVRGGDQSGDRATRSRTPTSASSAPTAFQGYRVGMPFFIPVDALRLPVPGARQRLDGQRQPPVQDRRRVEPHRGDPDVPRVRQRPDRLHLGERLPQLRGQRQRVRRVRGRHQHVQHQQNTAPARWARTSPARWRSTSSRPASAD